MARLSLFRSTPEDSSGTHPRARLHALIAQRSGPTVESSEAPTRPRHQARSMLPGILRDSRVDLGRLGLAGLALVGFVAFVVMAFSAWIDRPAAEPVPPPPIPAVAPDPAPQPVVISVVGRVLRPGLVTIEAGQRVADALDAAGGPLPDTDLTTLNLARKLTDGEQIYVGVPAPPEVAQPAGPRQPGADAKVDLNTATEEQLDELPGIGSVTAERIVQWRTEHGRFTSVEQLREVDGIGDTRFSRLRDRVRV